MYNGVICCLLQAGKNCRMNSCLAFSRIAWTCATYPQSLKFQPTHQRWFYNFPVKHICAVVESNSRAVSSGSYIGSARASLSHVGQTQRYCTNKADNKTEVTKESSPGLLRRFHQTYKEHGKILVCVHLVTSAVWASIFYCAALRCVLLYN